jgi:hypothetical protein
MTPDDSEKTEPTERLPYEPPAVVSEEVFETLALGCSKTSTQGTCFPPNTVNS